MVDNDCELATVNIFESHIIQFTLSTLLIKPNYLVILLTDAAPQFRLKLTSLLRSKKDGAWLTFIRLTDDCVLTFLLSFLLSDPICPPSAPETQPTSNQNTPVPKKMCKDPTSGLEKCFDPRCSERNSSQSCEGVVGCYWCRNDKADVPLKQPYCASSEVCYRGREGNVGMSGYGKVAHASGRNLSRFLTSMTRLFVLFPGWDASVSQGYPNIVFVSTHLYTLVERVTVRVRCQAQKTSPIRA